MKKFEVIDGKMGYYEDGKFILVNISVKYFRHYCEYIDECEDLDDAISFARDGHESDDMAFVGILVDGKLYETRETWFESNQDIAWEKLKQKIIKEKLR